MFGFKKSKEKELGEKEELSENGDNKSQPKYNKSDGKTKNPLKLIKKKQEEIENEKIAMASLTPYKVKQKLLIWNNGHGEKIYGYPIALIPRPNDIHIILYRRRSPDFIEEIISAFKALIFGKKEQYRVVHVPAGCIDLSDEIITIYAHSFEIINNYTEEAKPLEVLDPRRRQLYEIALQEAAMYKAALEKLGVELPRVIDSSLKLNPTMRAYQGKETQTDRKKGNKSKEFSGVELGFSFDNFIKTVGGFDDDK
ncbi:hypothetical protein Mjas_01490 [Methanothermococcus sp. Ax23]|uniref:hypothetical protein n=1 Tax=Methanothermococcus sp. Ax23 TaxID=3156486 RepID=UPI003BA2C4F0